jgi:DNA polymerase III gamma/tau subunit
MQRSFVRVIRGEAKAVSPEALEYLSLAVDGSFRDGVKILDLVLSNTDKVELKDIELVVSGSSSYKVNSMIDALVRKDVKESLKLLREATTNGVDLSYLIVSVMRGLRDKLLSGEVGIEVTKFIFVLDEVARRLATSLDGELLIQVAIVEWCGESQSNPKLKILKSSNETNTETKEDVKSDAHSKNVSAKVEEVMVTQDAKDVWKQVLGSLGSNNMALDTILSKARPGNIHGDELTVYVQYDFHKQQLLSEKNLVKLEQIISKAVGSPMKVKCEVSAQTVSAQNTSTPVGEPGDTIDDAMAIFTN